LFRRRPDAILLLCSGPRTGNNGISRSGSSSNGNRLWNLSSGRLWGGHAHIDSPA
jgi:hypothetical protein